MSLSKGQNPRVLNRVPYRLIYLIAISIAQIAKVLLPICTPMSRDKSPKIIGVKNIDDKRAAIFAKNFEEPKLFLIIYF